MSPGKSSYPAMFELERGNCNVLPLLAIVGIAQLLQRPRRTWATDAGIAACVAVAAGIKAFVVPGRPLVITNRTETDAGQRPAEIILYVTD